MGRGNKRRPSSITSAEEDLRQEYFNGRIGYGTYLRRFAALRRDEEIRRNGKVIK